MGKKRKLVESCTHQRNFISPQDRNEECRLCSAVKKPLAINSSRNSASKNRFSDGHLFSSSGASIPTASNSNAGIFKKSAYITAKCHAVGIMSAGNVAHKAVKGLGRLSSSANRINRKANSFSKENNEKLDKNANDQTSSKQSKTHEKETNAVEEDDSNNTYAVVHESSLKNETDDDDDEKEQGTFQMRQLPLRPLFFQVPQEEEQRYVKRDWIFTKIETIFSTEVNSRGVIIQGSAGTGKTTLALQLVEHSCFGRKSNSEVDRSVGSGGKSDSLSTRPFSKLVSHIAAYHFCQVDNRTTCLVPDFVHSIAAQLCQAPALSAYRSFLEENSDYLEMLSINNCLISPSTSFVNGIMEPLITLRKAGKIQLGYFILVLDSICEAESHKPFSGDTISSFLSKYALRIPHWFKIIITVRSSQLELLSLLPYKKLSLDSMDGNILEDLQEYIAYRFENISKLQSNITANRPRKNDILPNLRNHLKQLSGGCFLFLKLTLDLIENGHLVIKSISFKVLPVSLPEVFMLHCNLRFPTQNAFGNVMPILSTCLAALNPLSLLEIYHSVNSLQALENLPWVEFLRIFKNVQGLLVKRLDGTYMFFHSSFRDWLSGRDGGNSKFLCDIKMGHAAIAFRLIRVENPLNALKTLSLAHHMLKANVFKNGNSSDSKDKRISSAKELQAIWLISSSRCLSEALSSFSNIYSTNLKVSRLLLLAGASPNYKSSEFENKPLLVICAEAGNLGLLALLLEFGADIDAVNASGNTALHVASYHGHLQLVEYLVRYGASMTKLNSAKECPMVTATISTQLDVLSFFLSIWDLDDSDDEEEYNGTSISKEEAVLHSLISACALGHTQTVQLLLMDYCQMLINDHFGQDTPLTAACKAGQSEVVKLLLDFGANVNTCDGSGMTPLILAVREAQYAVMTILLNQGAKVNATTEDERDSKRTALMIAARLDDVVGAEILIRHDAAVNFVDKDGMSAFGWACLRNNFNVAHLFLQLPLLEINQTDDMGRSPLHLCAFSGSIKTAQGLLERGALLERGDMKGNRPIDQAVACGHIELIQLFLRKGAKLGATTWAMASQKPKIILILLNKLLEDGRFLYQNSKLKEAEHRFQYALKKIPSETQQFETEIAEEFSEIHKTFMMETLKCKIDHNDMDEILHLVNELLQFDPNSPEEMSDDLIKLFTSFQDEGEGNCNHIITMLSEAKEISRIGNIGKEFQQRLSLLVQHN